MAEYKSRLLEQLGVGSHQSSEDDIYVDGQPYQAFGIYRQAFGGETMLDIINFDGKREGFAYSQLYRVTFDPSSGLTLTFTEHEVSCVGYRLRELYRQLLRHRVTYIAVADHPTVQLTNPTDPVVTAVSIRLRPVPIPDPFLLDASEDQA